MISSISPLCPFPVSQASPTLHALNGTTQKVFEQVNAAPAAQSGASLRMGINFEPLHNTGNLIMGGFCGGVWAFSALFTATSLSDLYTALTVEHSASEQFDKIAKAVKTAFLDLVSLFGITAYNAHWAHEVNMISLGQYAPLVKGLGVGASLVINLVEGGISVYKIVNETEALSQEISPEEKTKHKQQLCIAWMKLIGNVCMVAWSVFGIASLAASLVLSPMISSALLVVGCLFLTASFFYQKHIEKTAEPSPPSQNNLLVGA